MSKKYRACSVPFLGMFMVFEEILLKNIVESGLEIPTMQGEVDFSILLPTSSNSIRVFAY